MRIDVVPLQSVVPYARNPRRNRGAVAKVAASLREFGFRVGYTTLLTGAVAFVANEPAPILMVLPTDDDCRDYVVSDLEPIFEASPAVAGALSTDQDESGRNTIRHRRFAGGSLKIVSARAPRNLRRHTARVLLIDEEDGMEVTPEGDPIDLAIMRTLSFPNRKIVRGSTPTDADTSTICAGGSGRSAPSCSGARRRRRGSGATSTP